ncbi:unnamed protein product [Arabidopsis halleri]
MEVLSSNSTCISVGEDFPAENEPWLRIQRSIGAAVLLHPKSLRVLHGICDIGEETFRFIDWLHSTGFSVWPIAGSSPGTSRRRRISLCRTGEE